MKYNPQTQKLYTNDMKYIKQLSCKYNIRWDMLPKNDDTKRFCSLCQDNVYDTEQLSDDEVVRMVNNNKMICLKISYDQNNIDVGEYDG